MVVIVMKQFGVFKTSPPLVNTQMLFCAALLK
jgi:hypothetical protein